MRSYKDQEKEEIRDFRDGLYLEDLPALDREMLEYNVVKKAKRYNFKGLNHGTVFGEATRCFLEAVMAGLKSVGLNPSPLVFQGIMQNLQTKAEDNIEIENRIKYRKDGSWQNGTYIFKEGELVYFIGSPVPQKPSSLAIKPEAHYVIVTNVRI